MALSLLLQSMRPFHLRGRLPLHTRRSRAAASPCVPTKEPLNVPLLPLQEEPLCPELRRPAHPATSRDKSAWVQPPVGYRLARSTEVTSQVDTPVLSTCVPRQRCPCCVGPLDLCGPSDR